MYDDFYAKIFLILYTPFENSTTRIAIILTGPEKKRIKKIFGPLKNNN